MSISLALLIAFLSGFYCEIRWKPPDDPFHDARLWLLFQSTAASIGLGGNIHERHKPSAKPPSIYKGDHLRLDQLHTPPPDEWRLHSRHQPKHQQSVHWPTNLGLHLFGMSSLIICVCMWFYNLNLKFAGFTWSNWSKATHKLVVPNQLADCLTFEDSFDKDNPAVPLCKEPQPPLAPQRSYKSIAAFDSFGNTQLSVQTPQRHVPAAI